MSKKKSSGLGATKTKTLVEELNELSSLGWVVTFGSRGGLKHKYTDIVQALTDANLDPKSAKAFLPPQAFSRACQKLKEDRVIDILRTDKDEIVFQFSKREVLEDTVEGGEQFEYKKEAKVTLNKLSGEIKCKNDTLRERAQKLLDSCMEERTTSDVTKIVQGLFDKNADLMPLPGAIGVYVVLKEYTAFVDQIKVFLEKLGRRPYCLPIPAGTQTGDKTVQETVEDYLEQLIQSHKDACEAFSISTRPDTLKSAAERIQKTRVKIEAYATYLSEKLVTKLVDSVEVEKQRLLDKVDKLDEERKLAPPSVDGKDRFGCKLGGVPALINSVMLDTPQDLATIAKKSNQSETRVESHLKFWSEKKDFFEKTKDGWKIKQNSAPVSMPAPSSSPAPSEEPF